ncbi:lipoprotein Spr [Epilithonimonas bovis DSM 19482]|uniref:Lipoprotein Spr n=1 Tax=Epilithonimonas bovis DSM 19482 TaxID=1121284 RepID=A0A1U7PUN5_9FLAO|nr:NlpC/P60 family protein [Epilithonimonas bovis]QIY84369.1 CHAP domain-containing protein [Chryseobacterium sp. NEB161]SIT95478.1 lipoprotein Spr [Epilithonimonas bovis DSM 19482]HBR11115.1 CHAP domain-containing protein [Chryseobacterium sp.]
MKKRVLIYTFFVATFFSLQSCVSNYVVSNNQTYKTDAKFASLDIKPVSNNSDDNKGQKVLASIANTNEVIKRSAIENAIKHSNTIDNILSEAESYLGTPYRFGGTSRSGIDCSAFVLSVFGAAAGMNLPRVAAEQSQEGDSVERTQLQKGDLVFFSHGGRRISHVGIVEDVTPEGEVKFIHAATSKGVMVSSLDDNYWGPKFKFAKRIVKEGLNLY